MPKFFFNIYDHVHDVDHEGVELDSPEEARVQAVIFAGDYLSDNPELLDKDHDLVIEVRDEANIVLLAVRMSAEFPAGMAPND